MAIYKNTPKHESVYYGVAGLTVSGYVSKDGAASGAMAGTITDIGSGLYDVYLTAADMNADDISLVLLATGMQSKTYTYHTESAWTTGKAAYLTGPVALEATAQAITGTAGLVKTQTDKIPSLALSGTALSTAIWTPALTGKINTNLDATVSSRAPSATALSNVDWTTAKALFLDAYITSRMASGATTGGGITSGDITSIVEQILVGLTGGGSVAWTYTVYSDVAQTIPLAGVKIWLSTDLAGTSLVCPAQYSDTFGVTNWTLDPGTYYVWRSKPGYVFTNPDTEVVS